MGFFRHSERTPKQKIKIKIDQGTPLFALIADNPHIRIRSPEQMKEVLDIVVLHLEKIKLKFNTTDESQLK